MGHGRWILFLVLVAGSVSAQVQDSVDRFTGERVVTYSSPGGKLGQPTFIATYRKSGDAVSEYLTLMVGNVFDRRLATSWHYLSCHNVDWILDGKPYPIGPTKHEGTVIRGGAIEHIHQQVTAEQLAAIGQAQTAEFRICRDEFHLTADDLAGIREMIARTK